MPGAATDACPESTGQCVGCLASCCARCCGRCISQRCLGMLGHQLGIRQAGTPKWFRSEAAWENGVQAWPRVSGAEPHVMPGAVTEAHLWHCDSAYLSSSCVALLNIIRHTSAIRARAESPGVFCSTACIVLGLYEAAAVAMRVSEGLISCALFLVPMHSTSFTLKL